MNNSKPIINKVNSFIKDNKIFDKGDNCLVAVSGGFDSTVLIDILHKIKQLFKISSISIAHINYNLRGLDSIEDMEFVKSLSQKYECDIFIKDINLSLYIKDNNLKDSLENIARDIRYEFFKSISINHNFNKIVLAHNANDHAETILLKLIRGTVSGLKGIEVKRFFDKNNNIEIVRPILCLSRTEIELYIKNNSLNPKTDITNSTNDYTRNRIRNKILPDILNENPSFLETIYRSSVIFNKENLFLDSMANDILNNIIVDKNNDYVILSSSKLISNDEILIYRIIKICFKQLRLDDKSFSFKHISAIYNTITNNISSKLIELPDGYRFIKDRDYLIFSKSNIDLLPEIFVYNIEDEIYINEINKKIVINDFDNTINPNIKNLLFSTEKLISVKIKNYDDNESFISFGKNNKITLKEYMDKNKVPQFIRKNLFLVYVNGIFIGIPEYVRSNQLLFDESKKSYYFKVI